MSNIQVTRHTQTKLKYVFDSPSLDYLLFTHCLKETYKYIIINALQKKKFIEWEKEI